MVTFFYHLFIRSQIIINYEILTLETLLYTFRGLIFNDLSLYLLSDFFIFLSNITHICVQISINGFYVFDKLFSCKMNEMIIEPFLFLVSKINYFNFVGLFCVF